MLCIVEIDNGFGLTVLRNTTASAYVKSTRRCLGSRGSGRISSAALWTITGPAGR
jgi:hypothetical protein